MSHFSLSRLLFQSTFIVAVSANAEEATVRSLKDDSEGLRQILSNAGAGDTIVFDSSLSGKTIKLGGSELIISQEVTIDASSLSKGLTLDAGGQSRVIRNEAIATVSLGGEGGTPTSTQTSTSLSQIGSFAVDGDFASFSLTDPNDQEPAHTTNFSSDRFLSGIVINNQGGGLLNQILKDITVSLLGEDGEVIWKSGLINPGNQRGLPNASALPLVVLFPPQRFHGVRISKLNPSPVGGEGEMLRIEELRFISGGAVLKNLTMTGGQASQGGEEHTSGGGILNCGHLALLNCSVIGNRAADGLNGADGVDGSSGQEGGEGISGGPGSNGGGIHNKSFLSITNSTIARNTAGSGGVGGLGGTGGPGGAGGEGSFGGSGGNGGAGGFGGSGGGIFNDTFTILALMNSTIAENQAGDSGSSGSGGDGGDGLSLGGNGGNAGAHTSGGTGGAILNRGQATIVHSTIMNNVAGFGVPKTSNGGEAGVDLGDGSSNGLAGTDGGESATNGDTGGVLNEKLLALANSIIGGESANSLGDISGAILIASEKNLLSDAFGNPLTNGVNGVIVADPDLRPLGDYGGPTLTYLPKAGSPVENGASGSLRSFDQRGFVGGEVTPDLGAVEFLGTAVEFDISFDLDSDGDGNPNGLEAAIGTDPFVVDCGSELNLKIQMIDGKPNLRFGMDRSDINLRLVRSTNLVDSVGIASSGFDFSIVDAIGGEGFIHIEDFAQSSSPAERAFYWLEASRQQ